MSDEDGAGVETEESSTEEEAAQAGEEEELPVQAMAIGHENTAASRLEQEANAAADSVLASRPVQVTLGAATSLQRQPRGGRRSARNQRCGRDSARVVGYPRTFISHIDVDVTSPNHDVTLSWSGPGAGSQPTGPFHSSPGAGCCHMDCNDRATSRTGGSRCTPKGPGTVHGHSCAMSSFPEARNVSWFGRSGIAFHFYPSVPNHPASHGCVRLGRDASRIIYDNTISNQTSVNVSGTWTRGSTCYRCGRRR
jgi:hypothetical protein